MAAAIRHDDGSVVGLGWTIGSGSSSTLCWTGSSAPREGTTADVEKPKSVEAYFEGLSEEHRAALQKLRETIAAVLPPEAEEAVVYSMPGFRLHGKSFVGYMAFKHHYSFFPMSGDAITAHRDELGDHVTGKGTISFGYGERLPVAIVRKVVKSRLAEVAAKRGNGSTYASIIRRSVVVVFQLRIVMLW